MSCLCKYETTNSVINVIYISLLFEAGTFIEEKILCKNELYTCSTSLLVAPSCIDGHETPQL